MTQVAPTYTEEEEIAILSLLTQPTGLGEVYRDWAPGIPALPSLQDVERMRAEYERGQTGYVYFFAPDEGARLKIGFTTDVRKRLASLQTGSHTGISPYYHIETVPYAEKVIHALLDKHRVRLEWFDHHDEVEQFIDCLQDIELCMIGEEDTFFTPDLLLRAIYDWSNSYGRSMFGGAA